MGSVDACHRPSSSGAFRCGRVQCVDSGAAGRRWMAAGAGTRIHRAAPLSTELSSGVGGSIVGDFHADFGGRKSGEFVVAPSE